MSLINCPECNKEVSDSANSCPNCGFELKPKAVERAANTQQAVNRSSTQPVKQKKHGCLFYLAMAFGVCLFLAVIVNLFGGGDTADNGSTAKTEDSKDKIKATEKPIEYTTYDVSELLDDLDSNAMKAENKYQDQYVEITGKLSNIDSDGKYISLVPVDDEFVIIGVQCYIKSDEQKDKVMEMSTGDTVTLRGQVTDIGEILGYSVDITDIK